MLEGVQIDKIRQKLLEFIVRKAVVAGLNRRVGGEHAMCPDLGDVIRRLVGCEILGDNAPAVEQIEGQQRLGVNLET